MLPRTQAMVSSLRPDGLVKGEEWTTWSVTPAISDMHCDRMCIGGERLCRNIIGIRYQPTLSKLGQAFKHKKIEGAVRRMRSEGFYID